MTDTMGRLPHHKLIAFRRATELLAAVRAAGVRDAELRNQAMRAAKSACLNCAEGAARSTRADKARSFSIARAEAAEAAAAVEIAGMTGEVNAADVAKVVGLADEVYAMLTPMVR